MVGMMRPMGFPSLPRDRCPKRVFASRIVMFALPSRDEIASSRAEEVEGLVKHLSISVDKTHFVIQSECGNKILRV
jgi:hypothetical protein